MRLSILLLVMGLLLQPFSPAQVQPRPEVRSLAPYVPTPQPIVEKMLDAARVQSGETVFDLGSGDGRVLITAAKRFKANAVGVEMSNQLVEKAREWIDEEGLDDKCRVIQGDLLQVDLSPADVVVLYLLTNSNEMLRPKLEKSLKPGARVVSHDFEIREWNPTRVVQAEAYGRIHSIYVYEVPVTR